MVHVTEEAAVRLQELLSRTPGRIGVRVFLRRS